MNAAERTARVIDISRGSGFDLCGVAPATQFPELANIDQWLEKGYAGEMRYLENPRRRSPEHAMQGARSVIVCTLNYNTDLPASADTNLPAAPTEGPRGWISRYAWGDDYHKVLGDRLDGIIDRMREEFGEAFDARRYVDTGPIVERVVAKYAGLGWLAKNTCLINEDRGSFFFLGVIVTTLDLAESLGPAELPAADLCGNCSLCIDACPTGAIVEPYILDARRCISYLTIELRGSIPEELRKPIGKHVFGCDICQDVCPWNRQSDATSLPNFQPRTQGVNSLFSPDIEWLLSLTEEQFRELFRGSPVKRTKWRGLVRNACVAIGNSCIAPGHSRFEPIRTRLTSLADSSDETLAEHARWALHQIAPQIGLPQAPDTRVVPLSGQG